MSDSGTFRKGLRSSARAKGLAATAAAAVLMLGCTTQPTSGPSDFSTNRPVTLAPPSSDRAEPGATLAAVDENKLQRAVERYRIKMDRAESPVETAGVDLTGDGVPEALALFSGSDWCTTTGCSFIVFQESETGYEAVSRTTRVRGPVKIGPGSNAGWRDLIVKTGGGAAPVRFVRLGFSGNGYPANALLQPGPTDDVLAQAIDLIPETPFQANASQDTSSAR